MYKYNFKRDSGGDVMLSGNQDRYPKRCFNIVNVPGGVEILIYDDSVPYSYFLPELGTLFIIYSR